MASEYGHSPTPAIIDDKTQQGTGISTADSASLRQSNMYAVNTADEQRLLRKLDLRLIPIIMLVYLVSFLDRGMYSSWSDIYCRN